ncbi:unnamed protein product [Caretta caretta]
MSQSFEDPHFPPVVTPANYNPSLDFSVMDISSGTATADTVVDGCQLVLEFNENYFVWFSRSTCSGHFPKRVEDTVPTLKSLMSKKCLSPIIQFALFVNFYNFGSECR